MFFYISRNESLYKKPLSTTYKVKDYYIQLDKGWHRFHNIFFKGYAIGENLENKVRSSNFSATNGNYVILDFSQIPSIYYDDSRAFPLFLNKDTLTNINDPSLEPIYFNGTAINLNDEWRWKQADEKYSICFDPNHKIYNKIELVDLICNYLITVTQQLDTDLPIIAANSPGVDTAMVKSAFDYCNIEYSTGNQSSTKNDLSDVGWGYNQMHIIDSPHLQLTGFCGDELLLRNPMFVQWLLDCHGIDLCQEFDNIDSCYMKGFFNEKYRNKILKRNEIFYDQDEGFNHTANVALNDFQMWHLDNAITFTPLRNLDIAIECLYAEPDVVLDQVMHGGLSKAVIEKLNPKNLESISVYKNNYLP
jgi:hypothetical protein